jgi:peptide deformylase
MAVLEIKKYPATVLRKKAEKVKEISGEIEKLIEDMIETLTLSKGVGLAAPQVGESKRVIVIKPGEEFIAFINPRIVKKSKEVESKEEGCLSFPELFINIKRPKRVEVVALNRKGEEVKVSADSFTARVFQHEIDHLDGVLFINKIGFWQRLGLKKELKQHGFNK